MKMLALRIDDKALLNLINQWLKAKLKHRMASLKSRTVGHHRAE